MSRRIDEQHLKPARAITNYTNGNNAVYEQGVMAIDFSGLGKTPAEPVLLRIHDGATPGGIGFAYLYPTATADTTQLPAASVPVLPPENVSFTGVNTVTYAHGRGYFPLIQVYAIGNAGVELIDAEVIQVDNNTVTVNFNSNETGFLVIH